jgi:N-acetylglutamate synthase/N-acetylornithine aminotransferase
MPTAMCQQTAAYLGVESMADFAVIPGIIEVPLPTPIFVQGIRRAVPKLLRGSFIQLVETILMTDRFAKTVAVRCVLARASSSRQHGKRAGMISLA